MNFVLSGGTYKPLRACRRPSSARISAVFKDLPHRDYARIGEAVNHDSVAVCTVFFRCIENSGERQGFIVERLDRRRPQSDGDGLHDRCGTLYPIEIPDELLAVAGLPGFHDDRLK